jgi:hypothetical protein
MEGSWRRLGLERKGEKRKKSMGKDRKQENADLSS